MAMANAAALGASGPVGRVQNQQPGTPRHLTQSPLFTSTNGILKSPTTTATMLFGACHNENCKPIFALKNSFG